MNKNRNRAWYFGTAIAALAVIVLGWLLGIQPQLAAATASDVQRAQVAADNNLKEAALADLKKQYEGIDDLRAELDELREALPPGADINGFLLQIAALNEKHGVTLTNISFTAGSNYTSVDPLPQDPIIPAPGTTPEPADGDPAAPEPAPTATSTPAPSSTATPEPGATSTPAAGDGTSAAADDTESQANADTTAGAETTKPYVHTTAPNPLVNPSNFITIDVALQFTASPAVYRAYIHDLQYGARVFLLTDLRLTYAPVQLPPVSKGVPAEPVFDVELTGTMYVLRT